MQRRLSCYFEIAPHASGRLCLFREMKPRCPPCWLNCGACRSVEATVALTTLDVGTGQQDGLHTGVLERGYVATLGKIGALAALLAGLARQWRRTGLPRGWCWGAGRLSVGGEIMGAFGRCGGGGGGRRAGPGPPAPRCRTRPDARNCAGGGRCTSPAVRSLRYAATGDGRAASSAGRCWLLPRRAGRPALAAATHAVVVQHHAQGPRPLPVPRHVRGASRPPVQERQQSRGREHPEVPPSHPGFRRRPRQRYPLPRRHHRREGRRLRGAREAGVHHGFPAPSAPGEAPPERLRRSPHRNPPPALPPLRPQCRCVQAQAPRPHLISGTRLHALLALCSALLSVVYFR